MIASEVREMLSFIDGNPTAYHTTAAVRDILLKAGFAELLESRKWALEPGKDYFVCRNGSSIIAFRMGDQLENYSFNVAAAHTDSPCFRIKENAEIHMGQNYTKLNTEGYGGMICATWPELFQPFLMPACVDSILLFEELPASKTDGRMPAVKLCLHFQELMLMPGLPLLYVMDPLF